MNYVTIFPTPIGKIAIAWEGDKILALQLPEKNKESLLQSLQTKVHKFKEISNKQCPLYVKEVIFKICDLLSHKPSTFQFSQLNLSKISPFHREVYKQAMKIPYGKKVSYSDLAKAAGSAKAFRAVGQAMAKNPFPLIVPCHRVLGKSGALVGFSAQGGIVTKQKLLELEAQSEG